MRRLRSRPWPLLLLGLSLMAGCGRSTSLALPQEPAGRTISRPGQPLSVLAKEARSGDRIVLGEGIFEAGITLPTGVSLIGAGFTKTMLDAKGSTIGLAIDGGSGIEIADLTIRNARQTNLSIKGSSDVNVRRIQASGGITGINLVGVTRGRVENSIVSGNRYGVVASGGEGVAIVNCTMVGNESLGLSLPSGSKTVAFNNVIVDGSVGVYLGEGVDARLDCNLYYTLFVGKQAGQVGRKSIGDWHSLTGQDGQSVRLPIGLRESRRFRFRAAEAVDWDPGRAMVGEWGSADFAGIEAPFLDLVGQPRSRGFDVGAYEIDRPSVGPLDGSFRIESDAGLKSAGIFTSDGRLIAYLFQNLPLTKGEYSFGFPGRDFQGRPIPAGEYEVRVVESDLRWDYLGQVGDTGADSPASSTASVNPIRSAFTDSGVLVMQQGWSEDGANIRGYDAASGRNLWAFEGRTDMLGLAIGGDGAAYSLRASGTQGQITRIDPKSGKVSPIEGWPGGQVAFEAGSKASGFAELDGKLYVADSATNWIRLGPVDRPSFEEGFAAKSPTVLASDKARHVLWAIVGDRLFAYSGDGRKLAEAGPFPSPVALAARDGRLAVASSATGKIHFYNATNVNEIKPDGTIGRGDGPVGPIAADRFPFQSKEGWGGSHVGLALGPKGELAVTERNRLIVFERDGTVRWSTFGVFGNETRPSHSDPRRVYDTDGRISFRLDESKGTWSLESSRILPANPAEFLGDFATKTGVFGVVLTPNAAAPGRDVTVYRLDGPKPAPISALIRDPSTGRYLSMVDANSDGRIDLQDRRPDTPAHEGPPGVFGPDTVLRPDGSLLVPGAGSAPLATVVPLADRNVGPTPSYDLAHRREIPRLKDGLISPYTLQPEPSIDVTAASSTDDGGIIANARLKSSPGGVGLFHNAGTDLIRFDAEGHPKWLHPLERHQGIEGLATVGPVTITGVGVTSEILAFNPDGLGLGSFGPKARVHYEGYFLDHPGAVRAYKGADGRTYALIADNYSGRHHWWRLNGVEGIVSSRFPVTLNPTQSLNLTARPPPRPRTLDRPSTPVVRIPQLSKDLVIDGGLAKWREAGITPQIIVTPETSSGPIQDPRDMSALIRLAYRGNDLYAQFLQFDDKVTFHQPVSRHYQHDGVELILNGFGKGFKFDATRTSDAGPIVIRSRFYVQKLDSLLDPAQAPRSIQVLDDASGVPERALIESVYGVDLARCRVIVTEFKLPIDATTYQGSPESLFPMKPGQTFRLGFLINDNDEPGTDLQHYLVWPATYSNFGPVEDGALAVLE
jgi:Right handed beta helix region